MGTNSGLTYAAPGLSNGRSDTTAFVRRSDGRGGGLKLEPDSLLLGHDIVYRCGIAIINLLRRKTSGLVVQLQCTAAGNTPHMDVLQYVVSYHLPGM